MLKIIRENGTLARLEQRTLTEQGITERYDLQKMMRSSPETFFAEIGEKLLLVGEETRPTDFVEDRIDLLAVDVQGAAVVIELKRDSNKLQLLQALSYAAMLSKWEVSRFIEERAKLTGRTPEEAGEELEQFMEEPPESLNSMQRIILVAEGYDYEVLATAEWLNSQYEVDIRCYRIELSADGNAEYLNCTCIYPAPELAQHAIRRSRRGIATTSTQCSNWQEILESVGNPAVVKYFETMLAAGCENHLPKRLLHIRIGGVRRFLVRVSRNSAYVWQYARFEDDVNYWRNKLGDGINLSLVNHGGSVRFFLTSQDEIDGFDDALKNDMPKKDFIVSSELVADEVDA